MCLRKTHDEPRIAQDDIVVWKVLTPKGLSPFQGYRYHPGMNKPARAKTVPAEQQWIYDGYLHAYTSRETAVMHAYVIFPRRLEYVVQRMLIPKGTIYYEGANGDICAERLYWPEEGTAAPDNVKTKET